MLNIKKFVLGTLGVCSFLSINVTVEASSEHTDIHHIDFSKPPSKQEQEIIKKHYQSDSQKVFNKKFSDEIYEQDKQEIMTALRAHSSKDTFVKERNPIQMRSNGISLGTYGDILVTYSFSSFGVDFAVTGHAAIVSERKWETIESMPAWFDSSKKDGVWYYPNNWQRRSKVYGVRVKNANANHYRAAAKYAQRQADDRKKYNLNFFNKGTTKTFYCSQLVWRAWKNQGFEVDRMNLGDWEPVSPAELIGGANTYVFYRKP